MFYTTPMLAGWLKSCVTSSRLGNAWPACSGGIVLLDGRSGELPSECLYIGDVNTVTEALAGHLNPEKPYILICAGSSPELEAMPLPDGVTLLLTGLDLLSLYNEVQYHVHKFLDWERSLQKAVLSNEGFQCILDSAYAGMQATLVMLNTGYKVLGGCYEPELSVPLTEELRQNGYLSFESFKELSGHADGQDGRNDDLGYIEYAVPEAGLLTIIWPIEYEHTVVGRLVAVMRQNGLVPVFKDQCRILIAYLREYMLSGRSASYGGNAAFSSLVADLLELRLTDPDELRERLKQVPLLVQSYYHPLVVAFPGGKGPAFPPRDEGQFPSREQPPDIPWNYVISQLQRIFPFSNITIYRNEILILVRKTDRSTRYELDIENVTHILSYYNGFMAVGNYSKFLTSLASVYHQARAAIRLGLAMREDPGQRVFYYEDYAIYHQIELATQSLKNEYGLVNLVYLCHPALIRLLRHDRRHHNDLCHVLYVYLTTDRNAAEASRRLYLHRNTMLYKIAKIEEILEQSLDDSMFRIRLLYSYHVLEYATRYLKVDILELFKGKLPDAMPQRSPAEDAPGASAH